MGSNTICSRAIPSLTLWCWCCSVMANTVVSNLPRVISWVHISLPRRPRRMPRIIFMHIQPFCQPCTQSQLWWHCHPEIDPSFPSALQCESKAWQQNATHTRAEITVAPGSRFPISPLLHTSTAEAWTVPAHGEIAVCFTRGVGLSLAVFA